MLTRRLEPRDTLLHPDVSGSFKPLSATVGAG